MSTSEPAMYALLVGIDKYASPNIPTLRGCVADVEAMEQLLHDKFEVPRENIKKLTNSQATHQAIKDAFREYLIKPAQDWVDAGRPEPIPAFLFHYSGHGSQAVDKTGTEPDSMDETLVPHDSRVGDVYDIKDWELGQLLDELTQHFADEESRQYSGNVTIILDCCHSGTGTRDTEANILPTRRCEPDLRPQPSQRPAATATRGAVTASGWLKKDERYVLLAGCRDREEANEHIVREGNNQRQHGAMTYFLIKELAQMSPDRRLTYRELHEQIRYQVNSRYKTQMPQCEGGQSRDRLVFEGVPMARDIFLTVVDKSQGFIWLNGGIAHGLTAGSELQVYPPETRKLADAGQPIAMLAVKSVGAVQSGCVVIEGEENIPINAKAAIYRLDPVNMRHQVVLDVSEDALRTALQARLTEEDAKNYVEIVSTHETADFRVQQVGHHLQIQDGTGQPLVAAFALDDLYGLGRDLIHLIRYRNALDLRNNAADAALAGQITVELKKLAFDPNTQAPVTEEIERTDGDELIIEVDQPYVLEVTNQAKKPLYFSLLEFGYAWDIVQVYPEVGGAHEPLLPGRSYTIGLTNDPDQQFVPSLPEDMAEARETFKVIATLEDADFEILTQGPLKTAFRTRSAEERTVEDSPLNQLLDLAMSMDDGTRAAFGRRKPSVKDEWITAQLDFLLIQPVSGQGVSRTLTGGTSTSLPAYNLELEPPAGFAGQVRVLTERQSTRAADGDTTDLKPPPGLAGFGSLFQPVGLQSTRAAGPTGAVIEIEADLVARSQVTESTPLKMSLPAESVDQDQDESLIVLAYDGNFFYPVGRPGDQANILNVEWLPDPVPQDETPMRSTRNLGRTVKLYVYKAFLGWQEPSLGLHKARFVPADRLAEDPPEPDERGYEVGGGQARYRNLRPGELQPGQRVALFVHGFTSETRWMVAGPLPWLKTNGFEYDHALTFDYETFNTHIADNGQTLADLLRAAGFGPNDGIHLDVFAHSMGTLVTRSMVELAGGEEFVNRCFLAGPPNQGTRLAEAKRLVPWISTLLLNYAASTPPTLVASWALKKVADDAIGGDDLRPTSSFISNLNGLETPARVPYYILAGRNDLTGDPANNVWQRVLHKMEQGVDVVLDTVFDDQNDLIINVNSMQTVRDGKYPLKLLKRQVVPCNHFEYFSTKEAQAQLLDWLSQKGEEETTGMDETVPVSNEVDDVEPASPPQSPPVTVPQPVPEPSAPDQTQRDSISSLDSAGSRHTPTRDITTPQIDWGTIIITGVLALLCLAAAFFWFEATLWRVIFGLIGLILLGVAGRKFGLF